jgi:hypothetical protein
VCRHKLGVLRIAHMDVPCSGIPSGVLTSICLCHADDLRNFLDRFGLKVCLKRQHQVEDTELAENKRRFGAENPISVLVEQKFLKVVTEQELDGGSDEMYSLGEAQMGGACECPESEIQGHLRDFMEV